MKGSSLSIPVTLAFLIVGEILVLAGLWVGIVHETHAMNQSVNDLSDLKDPSPYRAALMGHLGKIHLGLQGYLHGGDPTLVDQITLSRKDFEALLPEFAHDNPRLFPPAAADEIKRSFGLYKDAIDRTLDANTKRLEQRNLLDNNFSQIIYEIDHNIKPLIRKDQPDAEERSDAILNIENQVRAWSQNLVKAWDQTTQPAKELTFDNDNRGETYVERYGGMELLPRERKIQKKIQSLWKASSDIARGCFALEAIVSQAIAAMEIEREQIIVVLNRHLPAMPPAELEVRRNGLIRAMRLHLATACLLGLLGIGSVIGAAWGISRLRQGSDVARLPSSAVESTLQMDLNGAIAAWSMAAQALYGYSREEMLGKPISHLFESDSEIKRLFSELQSAHKTHFETSHKTKTGKSIRIRIEFRPITNESGQTTAIGLICIKR